MRNLIKLTAIIIAIIAGTASITMASEPVVQSSRKSGSPNLPDLPFLHEPTQRNFVCVGGYVLWNPEVLSEANRDIEAYHSYVEHSLREPTEENTRRALLEQLSGVITQRLNVAQIARQAGASSLPAESEIARYSAAWQRSSAMQLALRQALGSIGDADLARQLAACLSRQSLGHLARLKGLTDRAYLYALVPADSRQGSDEKFYVMTSRLQVQDYLARERMRARRILEYAEPYVRLVNALAVGTDAGRGDLSFRFWVNSLSLERGQDGAASARTRLDALIMDTLSQLNAHNCAERLAAEPTRQTSDDLFSEAAARLLETARSRCSGKSGR